MQLPFSLPDYLLSPTTRVLGLAVLAWLAGFVAARLFKRAVMKIASRTKSTWDDRLISHGFFNRVAHAVPAIIIWASIGRALGVDLSAAPEAPDTLFIIGQVVHRIAASFVVLTLARAFKALLDAVNDIYTETYADSKSRPIKGYLQVVSLGAYIAAGIVIVAVLTGRSPVGLLTGLGALAAVLMLVFRDTILSLVASVQIMSNDMIRIGDWVEMPQANANGDVIDIALHTVKIQNWDKTISTIPTSKFISESFKNWRGMSESGGRRIKRSLRLDMNSVRFLTDEEVDTLARWETLRDYMQQRRPEIESHNQGRDGGDGQLIPELRRLTNLGTFRVYVHEYVKAHPQTHQGMTLLTRQLAPGPQGVGIEIYCFSNDTAWPNYEAFQADIFDHLIAVLPSFGLRVFQMPTGSDFSDALAAGGPDFRPLP